MTLTDLRTHVQNAQWFSKLGTFTETEDAVAIRSLEEPDTPDEWDWLPTTPDQPDPIHSQSFNETALSQGVPEELAATRKELTKIAVSSLRRANLDHPLFRVGPSNVAPAARGAALYAVRMAASEVLTGREGFWCSVIPLYEQGFWPCGLDDQGRVVVL